jgi:hypothetical protein
MRNTVFWICFAVAPFSSFAQDKVKYHVEDKDLEEGIRQGVAAYNAYIAFTMSANKAQIINGVRLATLSNKYLTDYYRKADISDKEEKKDFLLIQTAMEDLSGKHPRDLISLDLGKIEQAKLPLITYLKIVKAHLDMFEIPLFRN